MSCRSQRLLFRGFEEASVLTTEFLYSPLLQGLRQRPIRQSSDADCFSQAFEEVEAAVRAVLGAIRAAREAVKSKMVSLADVLNDRRAALLALAELRECRKREERKERSSSLGWICEASSDEEELLERNAVVSELLDSVF